MKRKLIFSFMLVCVALFVYHGATLAGITGKISGIIKDAATGEPLPAVNVVIEGTTLGGATDNEGHYFIINIPPGTYTLQASMVGYAVESKTGVIVNVDHTTPIDFDLRVTAIAGEEVTVVAEREIVPMDISASHIVADVEQIVEVPLVTDIAQYIHLQAGIQGDYIRGGGLDQTQFMMDGLSVVDNRTNRPMMMVNLSAVRELNIIKGGFNPEYGNVRSGLINVVTKEGSPSVYHGSLDFRMSPAHLKHSGESLFNENNYYLRPFLDPAVCWVGTQHGTWDAETQAQYPTFIGWDAYSEQLLEDDEPINDKTPQECQDMFLWLHRAEGSGVLGQKEGKYGNKPDWNVDVSFGGPVPYVGKYLGSLSFFVSHRTNWEMFGLPVSREYYKEENTHFKLTSRLSASMKLTLEGLYGEINSVSRAVDSPGDDDYVRSGDAIFNIDLATSEHYDHRGSANLYWPSSLNPFDVFRAMQGIAFDHVLSPSTFYNVRISYVKVKNFCNGPDKWRDTSIIRYFGNTPMDESPYGFWFEGGYEVFGDQMIYKAIGAGSRDWSQVNTYDAKFDITSQVDRYNQIKAGFSFTYDDLDTHYEKVSNYCPGDSWQNIWAYPPYRGGGYVQDKLEFEGMIANFGVRFDYNEPNCDWYTVDRYSKYFKKQYKEVFTEVAPKETAKGHLKISPRLGISHPISEDAKLYFNYGHFYSMPSSSSMYQINYGSQARGISFIGNPSADLPRTVSYELGVEYNVKDLFLIHLSGYYKDVADQTGSVRYTSYDGSIDYSTIENNNFADVRGFELRLDKRFGRWITGWLNYNYMVQTSGYVGRQRYYQDENLQRIYGLQNPYQSRPMARPVARANVHIRSPINWGPTMAGIRPFGDFHVSALLQWQAGRYMTWDPLETYKLQQNVQWRGQYGFDARFSKRARFGKYSLEVFADVNNLFNIKYIDSSGFANSEDSRRYYESLHLPMYSGTIGATGDEYKAAGYIVGNDKMGDVKSADKPYIDMPNRGFLTYLNPRVVFFGLKLDF